MNKIGLYPGSFDPVTYGHLDLIKRGSQVFDHLYISVSNNSNKRYLFSAEERRDLLLECTKGLSNVEIIICDKLSVDLAEELQANAILRGLRAVTDFDYEMQMALTNRQLNPNVETIFMMTRKEYSFLSSSIVKEVAQYGGDISSFVPKVVEERLFSKIKSK